MTAPSTAPERNSSRVWSWSSICAFGDIALIVLGAWPASAYW
ncbi:hypothetical protein FHT08_000748 [Xanthomonas campestris]|nr:hypothetical protein [Xanthomonas sp. CFBP 8151]